MTNVECIRGTCVRHLSRDSNFGARSVTFDFTMIQQEESPRQFISTGLCCLGRVVYGTLSSLSVELDWYLSLEKKDSFIPVNSSSGHSVTKLERRSCRAVGWTTLLAVGAFRSVLVV